MAMQVRALSTSAERTVTYESYSGRQYDGLLLEQRRGYTDGTRSRGRARATEDTREQHSTRILVHCVSNISSELHRVVHF